MAREREKKRVFQSQTASEEATGGTATVALEPAGRSNDERGDYAACRETSRILHCNIAVGMKEK